MTLHRRPATPIPLLPLALVLLFGACGDGSAEPPGDTTVTTPDAVGLSRAQAEAAIEAAGLEVGAVALEANAEVTAGLVFDQRPASGTAVEPGTVVDLDVSAGPPPEVFSDEFDDNSLADWSLRHVQEGTAAQFTLLDIDQTTPGGLTIDPTQTPGWFAGGDGPLVFKLLAGNFAVHAAVRAGSATNPGEAPTSNFNSAGLMARDPAGADGPENYVMLNVGRQDTRIAGAVGSETKSTVDSESELFLDAGSHEGELVLCRVGNVFVSLRRLTGDAGWAETDRFSRSDLPETLQVGMVVNAYEAPPDLRAVFDFIRLLPTPASTDDCTP